MQKTLRSNEVIKKLNKVKEMAGFVFNQHMAIKQTKNNSWLQMQTK